MQRPRGYTLIEVGIVLAVAIIFLTAIAATAVPAFQEARMLRTGNELNDLARAAADAVARNLAVGGANFSFRDGAATRLLNPTVPICYDLSNFPGHNPRLCPQGTVVTNFAPPNGIAGSALPTQPLAAGSPLMAMVGGNRVYAGGFNAWCEPYVVCVYQYRVEVFGCIPRENENSAGLASVHVSATPAYRACAANFQSTGEPTQTAMVSVPLLAHTTSQLKHSYASTPEFLPFFAPLQPPIFTNNPRP